MALKRVILHLSFKNVLEDNSWTPMSLRLGVSKQQTPFLMIHPEIGLHAPNTAITIQLMNTNKHMSELPYPSSKAGTPTYRPGRGTWLGWSWTLTVLAWGSTWANTSVRQLQTEWCSTYPAAEEEWTERSARWQQSEPRCQLQPPCIFGGP